MQEDAEHDHGAEQILCGKGKPEQLIQQVEKQADQERGAQQSQFFTYDGKDRIRMSLRDRVQLLDGISQVFTQKSAVSDGIQCLQDLIALIIGVTFRCKPCSDTSDTERSI